MHLARISKLQAAEGLMIDGALQHFGALI